MDKQIIEISNDGFKLSLFRGFLVVENVEKNIKQEVPLDNILSLVLSANNVLISKNIINELCQRGANIIFCGKNYVPTAITVSTEGHWLVSERIKYQIDCSLPLKKNLWKSLVQNKIWNQALIIEKFFEDSPAINQLNRLARDTLSGDTSNNEGQAARVYFKALFGKKFIRDRFESDINILLNYSYTVLRAIVARAVVGNGLLPYIGLKHCTRTNTMPLVDDLIEPFRAIADKFVFEELNKLVNIDNIELSPDIKRRLTQIISYPVETEKGTQSLSDAIYDFVGTLVKSFENKKVELKYPKLL